MRWKSIQRGLLLPLLLHTFGCAEDNPSPTDPGEAHYAGSQACAACHGGMVDRWSGSGHANILTPVLNGQKPDRPALELPEDLGPAGLDWSQVSYVVGGFGWKAVFLGSDGTLQTGATALYRLHPPIGQAAWVEYAGGPSGATYDCGGCHTTGWQDLSENGAEHQDGLAGIAGTWAEAGVACEACHGPAGQHVRTRGNPVYVTREPRCADCHTHATGRGPRAYVDPIEGPMFVKSEGQADELALAGHAALECVDCHDPHSGVRKDSPDGSGIVRQCGSCHPQEAATVRHPGGVTPRCVDCHMPQATYSAAAIHAYRADVRTHIFKLRRTAETRSAMFETDGAETYVVPGGVTLDLACYQCHSDPQGVGGGAPRLSIGQLAGWAPNVHAVARTREERP